MPISMNGKRANFLDVIALSMGPYGVGVAAPHTPEPINSYHLDWQSRAACRGMGADLFFPMNGNSLGPAVRICARCPVLAECRTSALDDPSLYGVWARTSVGERRDLRSEEELAWE
jgi:WhiB family redox-sensing transcriptional regulator